MKIPGVDYTSLTAFSSKQRRALLVFPPVIACTLKVIVRTCRVETRGIPPREEVKAQPERLILAAWHETMGIGVCAHRDRGYHTLTSHSFDGELAARVVRHFDIWAVRGSSSVGGSRALADLDKVLEYSTVGVTVDGPRGPRRVAKPGVAILAARTGTPIAPIAFAASRAWRLDSWDRFVIPKPFSRILCVRGDPIPPPPDTSAEAIEATRQRVERELNQLDADVAAELGVSSDDPPLAS